MPYVTLSDGTVVRTAGSGASAAANRARRWRKVMLRQAGMTPRDAFNVATRSGFDPGARFRARQAAAHYAYEVLSPQEQAAVNIQRFWRERRMLRR
jgi:hypothetical protein